MSWWTWALHPAGGSRWPPSLPVRGGRVLGFDLQPIQSLSGRHVQAFELDVLAQDAAERIGVLAEGAVDCVLSDMAPRLSGIRDADRERALALVRKAFEIACSILRPRGAFLFKTFAGADIAGLLKEMSGPFETVQRVRSAATRKGSSEIYVVARGFRGVAREGEDWSPASGADPL